LAIQMVVDGGSKVRHMKVAVVVLNWNGKEYICSCLDLLKRLKTDNHRVEIIIVDNASTDGSVKLLSRLYPNFTLIENVTNLGYAEGNNVGIRYAQHQGTDFIWIVNPDAYVDPAALVELVSTAGKYPNSGILGSKIYFAPGFEFEKRYRQLDLGQVLWFAGGKMDWANVIANHLGINEVDHGQFDFVSHTDFINGASMLLRTKMLDEIGVIDPKYYLYYEENDLCQRAKAAGWELWYVPTSRVWHANAQSTGVGSPLVDYYTTRNRLLFGMRWAPWRAKLALLRESVKLLLSGRRWQRQGVADFYLARFGKGTYVD